jgi:hypothetical protein
MLTSEPWNHDVDMIDARIIDEMPPIDWHSVKEEEAVGFGLGLGLYRDQAHQHEVRKAVFMASVGTNISMSVMLIAFCLMGINPYVALCAVLAAQTGRACILFRKSYVAWRDTQALGQQVIINAHHLASKHPGKT